MNQKQACAVKSTFDWVMLEPVGGSRLTRLDVDALAPTLSAHESVIPLLGREFNISDDDEHSSALEDHIALKQV